MYLHRSLCELLLFSGFGSLRELGDLRLSVCLSARRSFNSMQACRLFPDPVVIGSGRASPGALRVNLFIFSPMKHDLLNNRMWTRAREYQRGYMATRRTTGKVNAAGRTGKAEL